MQLPPHIAERIRGWVAATPASGQHVDHEAARHGGICLMGTIGATWLLRPDGTLWDVDHDLGGRLRPLADEFHLTALVAGAARHPWLGALLPTRPAGALDCVECGGRGRIVASHDPKHFGYCRACSGLGWIEARVGGA